MYNTVSSFVGFICIYNQYGMNNSREIGTDRQNAAQQKLAGLLTA
jgi:hypothetical protein